MTEGRGQRTDRHEGTEARRGRRRKTDDRGQRAEDRGQDKGRLSTLAPALRLGHFVPSCLRAFVPIPSILPCACSLLPSHLHRRARTVLAGDPRGGDGGVHRRACRRRGPLQGRGGCDQVDHRSAARGERGVADPGLAGRDAQRDRAGERRARALHGAHVAALEGCADDHDRVDRRLSDRGLRRGGGGVRRDRGDAGSRDQRVVPERGGWRGVRVGSGGAARAGGGAATPHWPTRACSSS